MLLETYIHCFREYFYFYHSQIMISFLIYASAPFSAFSEGVGVIVSSGVGVPEISVSSFSDEADAASVAFSSISGSSVTAASGVTVGVGVAVASGMISFSS